MPHILLLGAGFSRNWGGLLASEVFDGLLAQRAIQEDPQLRSSLWTNQRDGGFENALADVQQAFGRNPRAHGKRLQVLQQALLSVFQEMNEAFFERAGIEFQQHQARMVGTFLTKFDAIFTLNQDVLLDHHYLNDNISLTAPQRWPNGAQLPGMRRVPAQNHLLQSSWGRDTWIPGPEGERVIAERSQPFFKLHGSTNWRNEEGGDLLIIGGDKSRAIATHSVLSWYFEQFVRYLGQPDTRLMTIGYSFRDRHINRPIVDAVNSSGLRFFVVDPVGPDVVRHANPSHGGAIYVPNELDDAFRTGLVGSSRRNLSETFGNDDVSHRNVSSFFG